MKKSKKNKSNKWFFKISWFVFVCLVSVLLAQFIMTGINDMLAIGKSSEIVQIELEKQSSLDEVIQVLLDKKLISEKWFFKLYSMFTKCPKVFQAGVYELESNMDYQSMLNHIKNSNNIKEVSEVTITEGMSALECANLMAKNEVCDKDEFLRCCSLNKFGESFQFIKDINNSSKRIYLLEGYLFPDTYKFYRGEKPVNVINKILNNYQKKIYQKSSLEGAFSNANIYELAEKQNISLDNLMTIASLIQSEAASKEDMYKVSSVINNRLETLKTNGKNRFNEFSMDLLRLDATIYYPYRNEDSIPKDIKKSFKGAYNTYKLKGLPPGPICNPGLDAIYAALFPAQTDYYYYCHSASGESFFARTNEVHLSNLKKAGLA